MIGGRSFSITNPFYFSMAWYDFITDIFSNDSTPAEDNTPWWLKTSGSSPTPPAQTSSVPYVGPYSQDVYNEWQNTGTAPADVRRNKLQAASPAGCAAE